MRIFRESTKILTIQCLPYTKESLELWQLVSCGRVFQKIRCDHCHDGVLLRFQFLPIDVSMFNASREEFKDQLNQKSNQNKYAYIELGMLIQLRNEMYECD